MLKNLIKGGLKPGMVVSSVEPSSKGYADSQWLYVVFPDCEDNLCAVKYTGGGCWEKLSSSSFISNYKAIYSPPKNSLSEPGRLIWTKAKGIIDPKYNPNSPVEDTKEETNQYFY